MRKEFKKLENERIKVSGIVNRFGIKNGYVGTLPTICLTNIKRTPVTEATEAEDTEDDKYLTDHIWLTVGKQIIDLNLEIGNLVFFEARIKKYVKGYYSKDCDERTIDYKLSHPTKFKKHLKQ